MAINAEQIGWLKMGYMNQLMPFFNGYYEMAHLAMTKGCKTEAEYDEVIDVLSEYLDEAKRLMKTIPEEADAKFKNDTATFLQAIYERLEGIIERTKHLKGKSFHFERYTFSNDRKYVKADMQYEKQIAQLGAAMNWHKQHIMMEVGM